MKGKKLKLFLGVIIVLIAGFFIYVEIANRNSKHMTYRQKVLKAIYPVWMWWANLRGKNTARLSHEKITPPISFYSLKAVLNNGDTLDFASLRGQKVLLVNTASDCGYTDQYDDLQKLYAAQKENLIILGFPANDFKQQEEGSDADIAKFCRLNYGVTFPVMRKGSVVKGLHQNEIFKWLTDKNKNGWNNQLPQWNFSKYLVDENGTLVNYFGPAVSPTGDVITKAIIP